MKKLKAVLDSDGDIIDYIEVDDPSYKMYMFVTGSNDDPRINDDWWCSVEIDNDTKLEDLKEFKDHPNAAIWTYIGPDIEDAKNPHPWDLEFGEGPSQIYSSRKQDLSKEINDMYKEMIKEDHMMYSAETYNDITGGNQ